LSPGFRWAINLGRLQIVPGLGKALEGMRPGDTKEITLKPVDAYGEVDPAAVTEVPKAAIPADALEVGTELIAQMHLKTNMDINTAFDDFISMHNQVKAEEDSLRRDVEINMTFDEGAVDELIKMKVTLICIKENLKINDTRDIQSKVMVTMLGLFAEIERDLISERTKEGLASGKAKESYSGGQKDREGQNWTNIGKRLRRCLKRDQQKGDRGIPAGRGLRDHP
jgi:hypothetical protein